MITMAIHGSLNGALRGAANVVDGETVGVTASWSMPSPVLIEQS
jgi:hypothetical protein